MSGPAATGGTAGSEAPGGPPLSGGLADPLDRDRARSLADEGGASGAVVEAEVVDADVRAQPRGGWRHGLPFRLAALAVALLSAYVVRRLR